MKKITVQQIADALNTSRITVWKALNNKPGINEKTRTNIILKAIELGYPLSVSDTSLKVPSVRMTKEHTGGPINIAVAISRPETSSFWMDIIHYQAMLLAQQDINLIYVYLPSEDPERFILPESLTNGSVQGMIVMNVYNAALFVKLNDLPIPKVFLDCPPEMSFSLIKGDLFLIEGISCVDEITEHMILKGRTKLRFIGDITYAQTNRERYIGFLRAMHRNNLEVPESEQLIGALDANRYPELIGKYLEAHAETADGFVCANDFIASIVIKYLRKKNLSVPDRIMVSGFDDLLEFEDETTLTTVHVKTNMMGIRLAERILHRLQYPDDDFEYTYIRNHVLFRASTGD